MSANNEASPNGKLGQSSNYNSVVQHTANSPSAASVSNSTMPLTALPSASKAKLGKVFDSLGVFNDELRGKTTGQKERYDYTLASTRVRMQDMERALEQEIKHRKQVQQKLEQECEERIAQVQREFESVIEERTSMMNKRLEILNERVSQLNSRIHEESARIPEDIEAKSRSLGEMLQNMQNDFLNERKDRLSRETQLLKQLNEQQNQIEMKCERYAEDRKNLIGNISKAVEESDDKINSQNAMLEEEIRKEMKELNEILVIETQTRKQEDDDIIFAVNRYMNEIQDSVSKITVCGI